MIESCSNTVESQCYTSSQKALIAVNIKACSIDHGISQNALIVVLIEPHSIEINDHEVKTKNLGRNLR